MKTKPRFSLLMFVTLLALSPLAMAQPCVVPDNGGGTVDLPPPGCNYLSPDDVHMIIDGLPAGTTINVSAEHNEFFNVIRNPGGSLGGEIELMVAQGQGHSMWPGFFQCRELVDFVIANAPRAGRRTRASSGPRERPGPGSGTQAASGKATTGDTYGQG